MARKNGYILVLAGSTLFAVLWMINRSTSFSGERARDSSKTTIATPRTSNPPVPRARDREEAHGAMPSIDALETVRKNRAQWEYGDKLEDIRRTLNDGDTTARLTILRKISANNVASLMDDSYIAAFAKTAEDRSSKVRELVATIAGQRWIIKEPQNEAAIQLALKLAADPVQGVRRLAVYYGLSNVDKKDQPMVERMIDLWLLDGADNDRRQQIEFGLRDDDALVRKTLLERMQGVSKDAFGAVSAYGASLDLYWPPEPEPHVQAPLKSPIEAPAELKTLVGQPSTQLANMLILGPMNFESFNDVDAWVAAARDWVPEANREKLVFADADGTPLPMLFLTDAELSKFKESLDASPHLKIIVERKLNVSDAIKLARHQKLEK